MPDLKRLWRRIFLPGAGVLAAVGVTADGLRDTDQFQWLYLPLAIGAAAEAWMSIARAQQSLAGPAMVEEASATGLRRLGSRIGRTVPKVFVAIMAFNVTCVSLLFGAFLVGWAREHWRIALPVVGVGLIIAGLALWRLRRTPR